MTADPACEAAALSPSGLEQLEFRLPSVLEGPLGLYPCSDIFVPVTVTCTDADGPRIVMRATDSKEQTAAVRVLARQVQWSTDTPGRVEVLLIEPGLRLVFPSQEQPPPCEIESVLTLEAW